MEVMSGVVPLDFRREEIAIRDIGKINSYSTKITIKNQLDNCCKFAIKNLFLFGLVL
jgi:hypothetical protein